MDTVSDFEDMLVAMENNGVRYLIVGGLAFIFHAKPRFTKDIDIWVDPRPENIDRANHALREFGSPYALDEGETEQILQIGLPPDRIDILQSVGDLEFEDAWRKRKSGRYGAVKANWIDLDSLISVKENIADPRHQADAQDLRKVREMLKNRSEDSEDS